MTIKTELKYRYHAACTNDVECGDADCSFSVLSDDVDELKALARAHAQEDPWHGAYVIDRERHKIVAEFLP